MGLFLEIQIELPRGFIVLITPNLRRRKFANGSGLKFPVHLSIERQLEKGPRSLSVSRHHRKSRYNGPSRRKTGKSQPVFIHTNVRSMVINPTKRRIAILHRGRSLRLRCQAVFHRDHNTTHMLHIALAESFLPIHTAEEEATPMKKQEPRPKIPPLCQFINTNFYCRGADRTRNVSFIAVNRRILSAISSIAFIFGTKTSRLSKSNPLDAS